METCHPKRGTTVEISVPAAFIGVSESDGRHNQMDFGQFLTEQSASEERKILLKSKKVVVFHPPECQYCSDTDINCRYCHGRNIDREI
jgi:hypothetical protein